MGRSLEESDLMLIVARMVGCRGTAERIVTPQRKGEVEPWSIVVVTTNFPVESRQDR